jgi:hypothetical protein
MVHKNKRADHPAKPERKDTSYFQACADGCLSRLNSNIDHVMLFNSLSFSSQPLHPTKSNSIIVVREKFRAPDSLHVLQYICSLLCFLTLRPLGARLPILSTRHPPTWMNSPLILKSQVNDTPSQFYVSCQRSSGVLALIPASRNLQILPMRYSPICFSRTRMKKNHCCPRKISRT